MEPAWSWIKQEIAALMLMKRYSATCADLLRTRKSQEGAAQFWYPRPKINRILHLGIAICRQPLWSGGQSSWLQNQRSGFDSRCYQIFWEVVGLERGPLSLVSTIEELLGRDSSGPGLEIREYGRGDLLRWRRNSLRSSKVGTNFVDKRRSLGHEV
jgi:hypothetical protein